MIVLAPPAVLTEDCPETPRPELVTNGDLLEAARTLRIDMAECNKKNARLREWIEANK